MRGNQTICGFNAVTGAGSRTLGPFRRGDRLVRIVGHIGASAGSYFGIAIGVFAEKPASVTDAPSALYWLTPNLMGATITAAPAIPLPPPTLLTSIAFRLELNEVFEDDVYLLVYVEGQAGITIFTGHFSCELETVDAVEHRAALQGTAIGVAIKKKPSPEKPRGMLNIPVRESADKPQQSRIPIKR